MLFNQKIINPLKFPHHLAFRIYLLTYFLLYPENFITSFSNKLDRKTYLRYKFTLSTTNEDLLKQKRPHMFINVIFIVQSK